MAMLTANGFGVVDADFVLPISRAWTVDTTVACSDPSKLTGGVTLNINDGALEMKGTASVVDVYLDTVRARIVAGAGGLAKQTTPKAYQQATVKIVLGDLLQTAGETLSTTADASVLATVLNNWVVSKMTVADAIGLLMTTVGASWRMLTDGTFWCGQETWPDSGLSFNIEHDDKAHQQLVVTLESPLVMPGTTLDGRKVSYVETHVDPKTVRSTVWLATTASSDRMRDPVVATVRTAVPGIDYLGFYRCKVVAQNGQTFDLLPDDARLPSTGFKNVPLRSGIPGLTVQVPPGSYLRLGWEGGDQSKPYCAMWEGAEAVTSISFGTSPDGVATKADITALITALNAATCGGSGSPITWVTPLPTSYASTVFKVQR